MTQCVIMLATKREDSRKPQRQKEGTEKLTPESAPAACLFVLTSVPSILHIYILESLCWIRMKQLQQPKALPSMSVSVPVPQHTRVGQRANSGCAPAQSWVLGCQDRQQVLLSAVPSCWPPFLSPLVGSLSHVVSPTICKQLSLFMTRTMWNTIYLLKS